MSDARVRAAQAELARASDAEKRRLSAKLDEVFKAVYAEKQGEVAAGFDRVHSVQRALDVGSIHTVLPTSRLRPYLIEAVERGMRRDPGRCVLQSTPPALFAESEELVG